MVNSLAIPYVSTYRSQLRVIVPTPSTGVIAVEQGDAEWVKEAMGRVWTDEAGGDQTRLKVDYPD